MAYTTIDNPELYFQVKTWTGTGSSNALTLDGDENMQPDYVMIKQRSSTQQWNGYDSVRGVQKYLGWNTNIAENTQAQGLTAFGSDGFTVGTDDMVNKSSETYVAFCWKESATAGFDIVSYTGNGSNRTLSHGLSQKPDMIIIKRRNTTGNWTVYHSTLTVSKYIYLHLTNAAETAGASSYWQTSEPTSSVVSLGTDGDVNGSSDTYISYFFCNKQGFSKFGSYSGNASTNGPYLHLGFKPAWFMTKKSNGSKDWNIYDNKRSDSGGGNANDQYLEANNNAAEQSGQDVDLLSNGVKIRSTSNEVNGDGNDFIYMAFAEAPFVNSSGVPANAR